MLEPSVVELPIKRLCIDLRLLGTVAAMLGLAAFVLRFTGHFCWLKADRFVLIAHGQFPFCSWPGQIPGTISTGIWLELKPVGERAIAIWSFGPGFWAMSAYCYAIVALSTLLLIQSVFRFKGLYRVQAAVMLFGVLLPWVIEIIDMLRLLRLLSSPSTSYQ